MSNRDRQFFYLSPSPPTSPALVTQEALHKTTLFHRISSKVDVPCHFPESLSMHSLSILSSVHDIVLQPLESSDELLVLLVGAAD